MQTISLLLVFLGGGLGSCSRYLISTIINEQLETMFPWGTLTVNVIGCLIIGVVIGLIERFTIHPYLGLFLATGFCGGFTTFSSFSLENNLLLRNNEYLLLFVYTFMSLFWGFAATFSAILIVRKF
ncbi:fluoride efflux transporter CrcB [Crocosphaera sp. XPORK-15E]|uniref:fluoride efflux transporter CrcB n=1 Tax=Crocosphaera sp. XPORK-15E TaxID=3110247 RepID=UPI002B217729|nr:fluoride efflux transporter CrcB [Crocosphaera sp. XPORK-15E]MEA5534633.1 fluoride efflux transporter CrcB [Crocosphaera sp. XPORK-15E]